MTRLPITLDYNGDALSAILLRRGEQWVLSLGLSEYSTEGGIALGMGDGDFPKDAGRGKVGQEIQLFGKPDGKTSTKTRWDLEPEKKKNPSGLGLSFATGCARQGGMFFR